MGMHPVRSTPPRSRARKGQTLPNPSAADIEATLYAREDAGVDLRSPDDLVADAALGGAPDEHVDVAAEGPGGGHGVADAHVDPGLGAGELEAVDELVVVRARRLLREEAVAGADREPRIEALMGVGVISRVDPHGPAA